jgi:methionyl aminopeptidase
MTLTIEPMVNAGGAGIRAERDQWTVRTEDGSDSAQWEHTVLVTEDGFEILTMREGEEWPERVLKRLAEQKEREDR